MTTDLKLLLILAFAMGFSWFIGAAMGAAWTVTAERRKAKAIAERYAEVKDFWDDDPNPRCLCGHEKHWHDGPFSDNTYGVCLYGHETNERLCRCPLFVEVLNA